MACGYDCIVTYANIKLFLQMYSLSLSHHCETFYYWRVTCFYTSEYPLLGLQASSVLDNLFVHQEFWYYKNNWCSLKSLWDSVCIHHHQHHDKHHTGLFAGHWFCNEIWFHYVSFLNIRHLWSMNIYVSTVIVITFVWLK